MSHPTPAPGHSPTEAEFIEVQASEEFADLRKTFRGFVFPLFVAFIAWYVFYIVTATFFPDAMAKSIYDNINLGMVLGLAQFVTAGLSSGDTSSSRTTSSTPRPSTSAR